MLNYKKNYIQPNHIYGSAIDNHKTMLTIRIDSLCIITINFSKLNVEFPSNLSIYYMN